MPPHTLRFSVAVLMQCTPLSNRWVSERWDPVAVLPVPSGAVPEQMPVCVRNDASCVQWRFDGYALELHRSEAEGYHLNLDTPEPKVFVAWRRHEDPRDPPVFPVSVTVSYNEAARMMDGSEQVDAVPMPVEVREWMIPFVAEHYKPEPKKRVLRNDPLADGSFRRERR